MGILDSIFGSCSYDKPEDIDRTRGKICPLSNKPCIGERCAKYSFEVCINGDIIYYCSL